MEIYNWYLVQASLRKLVGNPTNVQAAIVWGGTAGCTAIWLIQPFDYIKSLMSSSGEGGDKDGGSSS